MQQKSFIDLAYENKKKKIRAELFLEKMEKVLPWSKLLKPLRKRYPKGERGRPPIDLEKMLRIYFMQQWFTLGDEKMEEAWYDHISKKRFAGVQEEVPDETTICKFCHFLEEHDLPAKLFTISGRYLEKQGLLLRTGTIVDASIIEAPSSTKDRDRKRDPEMKQTKKGQHWYFGMKMDIGTDTSGAVHSAEVTNAAVQDCQVIDQLLHGKEHVVFGDKAYSSKSRHAAMTAAGKICRISRKGNRYRKLNAADQAFNRKSNRVRARIEQVFGVVKNLWGYRKVRYQGLAKNKAQVMTLLALANSYLFREQLI